ncbi:MAG: hypothetical protein OXH00_25945 [Candidatus Poribacteria bacterium]|nr:hypothetical protein [Candidatus Poribacteria bacterium]
MPARKMKPASFRMPQQQLDWLDLESQRTGLPQVEIVRRAIDDYRDIQAEKERRQYLTPEQLQNIREVARLKGVSAVQVVRSAIDREVRFVTKLTRNKKEG